MSDQGERQPQPQVAKTSTSAATATATAETETKTDEEAYIVEKVPVVKKAVQSDKESVAEISSDSDPEEPEPELTAIATQTDARSTVTNTSKVDLNVVTASVPDERLPQLLPKVKHSSCNTECQHCAALPVCVDVNVNVNLDSKDEDEDEDEKEKESPGPVAHVQAQAGSEGEDGNVGNPKNGQGQGQDQVGVGVGVDKTEDKDVIVREVSSGVTNKVTDTTTSPQKAEAASTQEAQDPNTNDKDNPGWMRIQASALDLIGNTGLVPLKRIPFDLALGCEVHAKLEFQNPTGSIMDRLALAMINRAEETGILKKGCNVHFGPDPEMCLSIALICSLKGYKFIAHVPRSTTPFLKKKIEHFGAYLAQFSDWFMTEEYRIAHDLEPDWAKGAVAELAEKNIEEYVAELPESVNLLQFLREGENKKEKVFDGALKKLVKEICDDLGAGVTPDYFVGERDYFGILQSVSASLREKFPECRIISVDSRLFPDSRINDIFTSSVEPEPERKVEPELVMIDEREAYRLARDLNQKEGLFCAERSGALMAAVVKLMAERRENQEKEKQASNPNPNPNPITESKPKSEAESTSTATNATDTRPLVKVVVLLTDSFCHSEMKFADAEFLMEKSYLEETDLHSRRWWWGLSLANIKGELPSLVSAGETMATVRKHLEGIEIEMEGRKTNPESCESQGSNGNATANLLLWKDEGEDGEFPVTFCTEDILGVVSKLSLMKMDKNKKGKKGKDENDVTTENTTATAPAPEVGVGAKVEVQAAEVDVDVENMEIRNSPEYFSSGFGVVNSHGKMSELIEQLSKYEYVLPCNEGVIEVDVDVDIDVDPVGENKEPKQNPKPDKTPAPAINSPTAAAVAAAVSDYDAQQSPLRKTAEGVISLVNGQPQGEGTTTTPEAKPEVEVENEPPSPVPVAAVEAVDSTNGNVEEGEVEVETKVPKKKPKKTKKNPKDPKDPKKPLTPQKAEIETTRPRREKVFKTVMLPLASLTIEDFWKWVAQVEDHHRKESGWNSNRVPIASPQDLLE